MTNETDEQREAREHNEKLDKFAKPLFDAERMNFANRNEESPGLTLGGVFHTVLCEAERRGYSAETILDGLIEQLDAFGNCGDAKHVLSAARNLIEAHESDDEDEAV
jgi:hypothetical protein